MSKLPPTPRVPVNRRDFLRAATAAAVAPMIVPRHVIARSQTTPPSDRITIGHIGVGRMGGGHVSGFLKMPDVRILGISDVRLETLERVAGRGQSAVWRFEMRRASRFPRAAGAARHRCGRHRHRGTLAPADWHRGGAPREAHLLREAAQRHAGRRAGAADGGAEIRRGLPVGHAAAFQRQLPAHRGAGRGTATSATSATS